MGRELKRVPLDFNWKIGETWKGYINPYYKYCSECRQCSGIGYSREAKFLYDQWYGNVHFSPFDNGNEPYTYLNSVLQEQALRKTINSPEYYGSGAAAVNREAQRLAILYNERWYAHLEQADVDALIKGNRLWDFTHTWTPGEGWKPKDPFVIPTAKEVNEWSMMGFGHDAINCSICVRAKAERLGYKVECDICGGKGSIWNPPEMEGKADEWVREEPPIGEGYQLWETVSEGSPISPVFKTPEELASWLATSPDYEWKENDEGTTYEQWLKFITDVGSAPSMIVDSGVVQTGVQAFTKE